MCFVCARVCMRVSVACKLLRAPYRFHNVHINVAVSTDNGLYSPLIQNVQNKGLVDINDAVNDLAVKARSNKLHANELQVRVQEADFTNALRTIVPSVSTKEVEHYEQLRQQFSAV